jgi:hypothetical protein
VGRQGADHLGGHADHRFGTRLPAPAAGQPEGPGDLDDLDRDPADHYDAFYGNGMKNAKMIETSSATVVETRAGTKRLVHPIGRMLAAAPACLFFSAGSDYAKGR